MELSAVLLVLPLVVGHADLYAIHTGLFEVDTETLTMIHTIAHAPSVCTVWEYVQDVRLLGAGPVAAER